MTIEIWSDFACPFCYIGETRLINAIKELGLTDKVEILYRAFELDPSAPEKPELTSIERMAKKYNMPQEKAQKRVDHIDSLGKELGIDFRYATAKPSNTFDAHRVMKLAEAKYNKETVDKLNMALFDAYFTKNLVLADWKVLKETAKEIGMKEEEVDFMLNSVEYGQEVREDEDAARLMSITGVPYFVFNKKYAIPGCISQEDFKDALQNLMRETGETVEASAHEAGSCGPDGCNI